MKKTLTINISGSIFHIDEDAFEKLQDYLRTINSHYGPGEEGREIISDIESRIAEIFQEKLSSSDQVVNVEMVEEVITIMGRPEEIFETEEEASEEAHTQSQATMTGRKKRRLYRDPDKRVFGGVASGLSAYFGIDVVVFRLLFVLFFFLGYGFAFLLYIILWIVVPKALTTSQKLEMKGKKVNISNIEESIKDEYKEVKDSFDKMREKNGPQVKDGFDRVIDFLGSALRLVLKVIIILLGIGFIFAGFVSLISFIGSMIFARTFIGPFADFHFSGMMLPELFLDGTNITLFTIGILIVIAIPLMLLIFAGIKLIFNFKTNNKAIGFSALAVWLAGIILLIALSFSQMKAYMHKKTVYTDNILLEAQQQDILYLQTYDRLKDGWYEDSEEIDGIEIIKRDGEELLIGEVTLDIEKSHNDKFEIKLKKSARGRTSSIAADNAQEIKYNWNLRDSVLIFDKSFILPDNTKWRNQRLHVTLKVPEGKVVYLDDSMKGVIHDIDNVSNTWDFDMLGEKWIMKKEGLSLVE
jgi:phage shock protein PspC (stress-responsive transcriptional regulator)